MTARSQAEARTRGKPLWRELEDAERSTTDRRAARTRRLAVVYDIEGPRVRLGILWFLVTVGGLWLGLLALALVYAIIAGVAALQTARAWRAEGERPDRRVAGLAAAGIPLAAAWHTAALGVAVLALAGAAMATGMLARRSPAVPVRAAGFTIQCSLFAGLAAASPVLAYRFEAGAAIVLVLLVASYEIGDYLIGSGATNPFEGPTAGALAIAVTTFIVAVLEVPPFEGFEAWVFGGLAALLVPLGQLAGSLVLPDADANAPALRRLDSLMLYGPVFAWGAGVLAAG